MTSAAFVLKPVTPPARALHHFTAATDSGFFLSRRNPIPNDPALDALHCNMPSATIVAATTCVRPDRPRGMINANQKHMRNAA